MSTITNTPDEKLTYLHEGDGSDTAHLPQLRHILGQSVQQHQSERMQPGGGVLVSGVSRVTTLALPLSLPGHGLPLLLGQAGGRQAIAGRLTAGALSGLLWSTQVSIGTAAPAH